MIKRSRIGLNRIIYPNLGLEDFYKYYFKRFMTELFWDVLFLVLLNSITYYFVNFI